MIDFERKEHYGLSDLLRIVALLRSEDGCPWDRVQTHASLRRSPSAGTCWRRPMRPPRPLTGRTLPC